MDRLCDISSSRTIALFAEQNPKRVLSEYSNLNLFPPMSNSYLSNISVKTAPYTLTALTKAAP